MPDAAWNGGGRFAVSNRHFLFALHLRILGGVVADVLGVVS
jgi:hypothetical protein